MQHVSCLPQLSELGKMIRRRVADYGDLIRAARTAAGLTQRQLAAAMGVSHATVSQWEKPLPDRKRPSLDNLEKACDVLGITVRELFCRDADQGTAANDLEREVLKLLRGLTRDEQIAYLTILRAGSR